MRLKPIICLLAGFCAWSAFRAESHAQTAWPAYMASLASALSESTVTAVLLPDVKITVPDAGLSKDKARWSGLWAGWACRGWQCDVRLAVEQVSESGATVVYAGATAGQAQITERAQALFDGDELHVRLRTGAKLALRMRLDGDVELSLWKPDDKLVSAGVLTQKKLPYTRTVERVPTPWTEGGQPLKLEMVTYRPLGVVGPFPTVILNHGSTGNGDKPEWFTFTWTSPDLARYFLDKGWQVMFPQRRGRGKSDGLYDEGFEKDRSRYACQPELSLPGLERAMADLDVVVAHLQTRSDVDMKRLLIGGVSRGGILSTVYAGTRATPFLGVLNFVGGWVGDRCLYADRINTATFQRAATFTKPMLWLYGDKDPFYSLKHSRQNFDAFVAAGGQGRLLVLEPPVGQSGHSLHTYRTLWQAAADDYLTHATKP